MKTFWKILPLALPILVLISVLSACGKDGKIVHTFSSVKAVKKDTQAQRANGAQADQFNADAFQAKCFNELKGHVELSLRQCVVPLPLAGDGNLDPGKVGDQVILENLAPGNLILSRGTVQPSAAEIDLSGAFYMNVNDREVASRGGRLSYLVKSATSGNANVSVWSCLDENFHPAVCNPNVLQGR
jgi:hypothetical protein